LADSPEQAFTALCKDVIRTGKPKKISVREVLRAFGQERRGHAVVRVIRGRLRYLGVETEPSFEQEHIDAMVTIVPRAKRKPGRPNLPSSKTVVAQPAAAEAKALAPKVVVIPAPRLEEEAQDEGKPYLTVALLAAANRKPYFVRRSDPLEKVTTLMLMHNIGHVLVMQSERSVDGIVTWRSIGQARAANKVLLKAGDCMETNIHVVPKDASLFHAVSDVIHHGLVLVQSQDKIIYGPITTTDVAEQFVTLSEPFLFLEQIETLLRSLMKRARLTQDELQALIDPADVRRKESAKTLDDLTFGEYLRGMSDLVLWGKLKLGMDRTLFIERLDAIRRIRNGVMHFHPDGISPNERDVLAKTREMLQAL